VQRRGKRRENAKGLKNLQKGEKKDGAVDFRRSGISCGKIGNVDGLRIGKKRLLQKLKTMQLLE